jgi:hypothetical protein
VELDREWKDKTFDDKFYKISDFSFNPAHKEELSEIEEINVYSIFNPKVKFNDIRGTSGFQKFLYRILNFLNHIDTITLKPQKTIAVPLTVKIINGKYIPYLDLELSEELSRKGLIVTKVVQSKNSEEDTYAILYNTSFFPIIIEDLGYLGKLKILHY